MLDEENERAREFSDRLHRYPESLAGRKGRYRKPTSAEVGRSPEPLTPFNPHG